MTGNAPGQNGDALPEHAMLRRVRFVADAAPAQQLLLSFSDPVPCHAVCVEIDAALGAAEDGLDVLTLTAPPSDQLSAGDEAARWVASAADSAAPLTITLHGAQIVLSARRAALRAPADRAESFLHALVDFHYHQQELLKLERETAASWPGLSLDSPLATKVGKHDPERFEAVGRRMQEALARRLRLARIIPHLKRPRPHLPPLANQLLDRLREKANIEERLESLSAQMDVFDRIYEMNSQRIDDFTIARQERTLEWTIIILLAAETLLLLIDILWTLGI